MVKRHGQIEDPKEWVSQLSRLRPQKDIELIHSAISLYDESTVSLLPKGIAMADILLSLGLDTETLAASLLFPAVLAHELSIDFITDRLGENIRKLLHDVLQMQSLGKLQQVGMRNQTQIENLRKMLLAMVTDVRAVLVVFAERIWQLHDAKNMPPDAQRKLAQETLDVFAPLANRLGVWQLKWEIEDLCLRYLQPETYSKIAKWLASRRQEREAYVQQVIGIVSDLLQHAQIKDFKINGRVKHIYSIYRKMQRKSSRFDEIYDITALRVLVPSISDCYSVLSILQDKWEQVLEEFDDYISQPKPNGYRSIHTVLLGPEKHYVEVQIRTYEMHEASELGVAAHWRYKEGVLEASDYAAKIALLRQIMAWQKEVALDAENKGLPPKPDLFAERIYVFTPAGDIVDLPQSATPLDFAYQIHSEVGHRCRGAKINGNIVPLTHSLQTGERVEILTAKQANPSRDWLNIHLGYLKTPRARAKVHHWFKMRDMLQNISIGRELLAKELKKYGLPEKTDLNAIAGKFNYKTADELLAGIAAGDVKLMQVVHVIHPSSAAPLPPLPIPVRPDTPASAKNVQIVGINNLMTQMARCCKPLPGDAILGYVTRNRGVSIHRKDCSNVSHILENSLERLIEVSWGEKISGNYSVDLVLRVSDRAGLLRDITTLLASEKIDVLGLQAHKNVHAKSGKTDIYLTIEIKTRDELKKAIDLLKQIPNMLEVRRV